MPTFARRRTALLLFFAAGCASDPGEVCSRATLARLASEDCQTREEAQAEIESLPPECIEALEETARRQSDPEVADRLRQAASVLRWRPKRDAILYRLRSTSKLDGVLIEDLASLGDRVLEVLVEASDQGRRSKVAEDLVRLLMTESWNRAETATASGSDLFDLALAAFFPSDGPGPASPDAVAKEIVSYFSWGGALARCAEENRRSTDMTPLMVWVTLRIVPEEVVSSAPPGRIVRTCCEWLRATAGGLRWNGRRLESTKRLDEISRAMAEPGSR